MVLDLWHLHECAQQTRATICRRLLQVGATRLYVLAEQPRCPGCVAEVVDCGIDVVRQIALRLAQVGDLRLGPIQAGLEDGVQPPGVPDNRRAAIKESREADELSAIRTFRPVSMKLPYCR
jgi:hypothetical protein